MESFVNHSTAIEAMFYVIESKIEGNPVVSMCIYRYMLTSSLKHASPHCVEMVSKYLHFLVAIAARVLAQERSAASVYVSEVVAHSTTYCGLSPVGEVGLAYSS